MLLAKTDGLHGWLSGPATKKIMERECQVYRHTEYEADLNVFSLKLQIRTYFTIEVIAQPLWITYYRECLTVSLSIAQSISADNHLMNIRCPVYNLMHLGIA
jgi:hypothetical protein